MLHKSAAVIFRSKSGCTDNDVTEAVTLRDGFAMR
jgi:hypothetical protein